MEANWLSGFATTRVSASSASSASPIVGANVTTWRHTCRRIAASAASVMSDVSAKRFAAVELALSSFKMMLNDPTLWMKTVRPSRSRMSPVMFLLASVFRRSTLRSRTLLARSRPDPM